MIRCAALIPARYASTRLPGKPLLKETGKYLIQHVVERVRAASRVDRVLVATDDERIASAVESFGGNAVMTSRDHATGTDRIAEAAAGIEAPLVLNVQGDEPEVDPRLLDRIVECLDEKGVDLATAAVPIRDEAVFASPHAVKVVTGENGIALYFSRAPIPYPRGARKDPAPLKHIGVYGYRREALIRWASLAPVPLEMQESLEQLRPLYYGMRMKVILTEVDHHGIDTPEDYAKFLARMRPSS